MTIRNSAFCYGGQAHSRRDAEHNSCPHPELFELGLRNLLGPGSITPAVESGLGENAIPLLVLPHRREISSVSDSQHLLERRGRQRASIRATQVNLARCPAIATILEVLPDVLILEVRPKSHRHTAMLAHHHATI